VSVEEVVEYPGIAGKGRSWNSDRAGCFEMAAQSHHVFINIRGHDSGVKLVWNFLIMLHATLESSAAQDFFRGIVWPRVVGGGSLCPCSRNGLALERLSGGV
jgi:hypothetical protein